MSEEANNKTNINTSKSNNTNTLKAQEVKRFKTTVYLSEEAVQNFNEIYAKRILANRKTDKTDLFSEAIALLYREEYSK